MQKFVSYTPCLIAITATIYALVQDHSDYNVIGGTDLDGPGDAFSP